MISIVDYGLGNIRAFLNVFKRLNVAAATVTTAEELDRATKVILPGVGHFDHAMERLQESGMRETLDDLVVNRRVPVLGVCVGMQILARSSDEGARPGLGYIAGRVKGLAGVEAVKNLHLPHMGWNDVRPTEGTRLFSELESDARFYFLHSFYFECDRPQDVAAVASYGTDFSAAVSADNVHGVQFHPEKSHHFGTRLLKNFADL
jgi:glutamine amidotransferase